MTVHELIAILQKFPGEKEVVGVDPVAPLQVQEYAIQGASLPSVVLIGQA